MIQPFTDFGRIGQERRGGIFYEEFLPELRGLKGIRVYKEMADNDSVVGAILYALEMLIRQASWDILPGGPTGGDHKAARFVRECMGDMETTWTDVISEVLSFLTFGWSYHEVVYKRRMGERRDKKTRSKFNDGLIGWRKLPIRAQDTLYSWAYEEKGDNLLGMTQTIGETGQTICIPLEKALHFRTKSRKDNPEGRSILRSSYRAWYFKRRIEEIEGIGMERDLAGLPVIQPPEGMDIWNPEDPDMVRAKAMALTVVQNIRRDHMEGVVLPPGWQLKLLSTGGNRQFDTNAIIERYDTRIAMATLADFVLLGHQKVGSFALSSDKTRLFSVALGAYMDSICQVFNHQAIPALLNLNRKHFSGLTAYPTMVHGDVETPNLTELGRFIRDMTGIGLLMPDEALENHIRMVADLPEKEGNNTGNPMNARKGNRNPPEYISQES